MLFPKESQQTIVPPISELFGNFELHFKEKNIIGSGCITLTSKKICYYMTINEAVISSCIPVNDIVYVERDKQQNKLKIHTTNVLHSFKLLCIASGDVDHFVENVELGSWAEKTNRE